VSQNPGYPTGVFSLSHVLLGGGLRYTQLLRERYTPITSCRKRGRETSVVATTVPVSSTVIFTFSLTITFNVSVTVTMTLTAFYCDQK